MSRVRSKREHYYRMAKRLGYRSRAAFKLIQLDRRHRLFSPGDVVVDLGAAPGGWLQVAAERVGGEGFVIGVDLNSIAPLGLANVRTLRADILQPETAELILDNLPREADVVLSDASPKISGVWTVDHARSVELARGALRIAMRVLRRGGRFVVKVFQGEEFPELVAEVRRHFDFVKVFKPEASRKASAEAYIVARGFKKTAGSRASP
jgi:23S rRNA (uridine2552-2'-O)-methyltransferase